MILFTILTLILLILIVAIVLGISLFGAGAIIIFGDVIVCGAIIGFILYKIISKKKNNKKRRKKRKR